MAPYYYLQEPAGSCMNGCCRTNPCLNGGSCTERCNDVTVKFECFCAARFTGKVCEKLISSCSEYQELKNQVVNGIFEIASPSTTGFIKVFCDFTSEPEFVWTLVESFEKGERHHFHGGSFSEDIPINPNSPMFSRYRLPLNAMTHLLSQSTHFRATCEFEKIFSYIDYLRGNVSSLDLMAHMSACKFFERINIRGIDCMDCKAYYWSYYGMHAHIESTVAAQWYCQCATCVSWRNSIGTEDSFGYYDQINPAHRCVQNDKATTQWWLGVRRSS